MFCCQKHGWISPDKPCTARHPTWISAERLEQLARHVQKQEPLPDTMGKGWPSVEGGQLAGIRVMCDHGKRHSECLVCGVVR